MGDLRGIRALLGGPVIYMIFVGALSIVLMLSAAVGRLDGLFYHAARGADRLQRGIAIPMVWGTPAVILAAVIGLKMLQLPAPARLLGVLALLLLLSLSGVGVAVAALALGRSITLTAKAVSDDDLTALRLGLSIFFAAEFVPIAGWILVFLAGCAGAAAFLESLFQKQPVPASSEIL